MRKLTDAKNWKTETSEINFKIHFSLFRWFFSVCCCYSCIRNGSEDSLSVSRGKLIFYTYFHTLIPDIVNFFISFFCSIECGGNKWKQLRSEKMNENENQSIGFLSFVFLFHHAKIEAKLRRRGERNFSVRKVSEQRATLLGSISALIFYSKFDPSRNHHHSSSKGVC